MYISYSGMFQTKTVKLFLKKLFKTNKNKHLHNNMRKITIGQYNLKHHPLKCIHTIAWEIQII